jgi:hypothetical protein
LKRLSNSFAGEILMKLRIGCVFVAFLSAVLSGAAQTSASNSASASVPPVIQFSNVALDEGGTPLTGTVSITFSLYNSAVGGQALWSETQNVQLGNAGQYSVYLGLTQANGLPSSLFISGQAQWLGVRVEGQPQQPRVFLVSVPYAMKAGDAATIGGLPPSAFVMAATASGSATAAGSTEANAATNPTPATNGDVTGLGTVDYIPIWDSTSDIISSVLYQSGTGTTAKIGINTTTPATTLDVKGGATLRGATSVMGALSLPATGTATASAGKASQPIKQVASAYNSSTNTAVNQAFEWQTEPVNNDTSTAGGTLNLLFGEGTAAPAQTGLSIASNGQITFATGQTFPGTGEGTITGVTAGTDLTGGGTSGNVALNLNTSALNSTYAQLAAANTFTGNQTVNGNLSATGVVTGSIFQIGSNLFAFGSYAIGNAFLGFAGNTTMTGSANTAIGSTALEYNTTGIANTASGFGALYFNTTGNYNTASGDSALFSNTTGAGNTASGSGALGDNTTGNSNIATGSGALQNNTTGSDNTASGVSALVQSTSCCNTASGYQALYYVTTGQANTGIGNNAGKTADESFITGANNTFLGTGTAMSTGSLTNATAIGANAEVEASNTLILGSINGVNGQKVTVKVGIGTTTPDDNLTVDGTADKTGGGSWGTYSDRRLKNLDGSFNTGLSQILKMNPVRYRYKEQNAMGIRDTDEHVGLVAQEVQKVIPEAVTENSKGYLLVNNDPIIWAMLNAIKEQQKLIQRQQKQIAHLTSQVQMIRTKLKTNGQSGSPVRVAKAAAPASGSN